MRKLLLLIPIFFVLGCTEQPAEPTVSTYESGNVKLIRVVVDNFNDFMTEYNKLGLEPDSVISVVPIITGSKYTYVANYTIMVRNGKAK
jgi:hypothetical protein